MNRFELWLANLPGTNANPLVSGYCPVVIVSDPNLDTPTFSVSVVPLTEDRTAVQLPTHVLLCSQYLEHPNRALCEQVTTVDKARLLHCLGSIVDPYDRFALNRALAIHLNLTLTTYLTEESLYEASGYI